MAAPDQVSTLTHEGHAGRPCPTRWPSDPAPGGRRSCSSTTRPSGLRAARPSIPTATTSPHWRAAKVLVPIVLTFVVVHVAIRVPWPHLPFPDLPSVPWPDVPTPDLPDWHLPDWVWWLLDKVKYVWPVVFAVFVARAEVRRRRQRSAPPDVRDAGPHEREERPRR